jgi:tripeptide aminopeptidase
MGHDIVTASGETLLGADNKAGVAEIVTAAEYLMAHPEIPHGPIRLAFTPDEEIGRGTLHFDVARFGADYGYTVDGASRGEVESESFSADAMTVTIRGVNAHAGYAKGRLVNALKVMAAFLDSLPRNTLSPETTEGRAGFVHPHELDGTVEQARVKLLIRDFATAGLREKENYVEGLARAATARWPGARVDVAVEESYRNMKEVLDRYPEVVDYARAAVERAGLTPSSPPIRGGTDGSKLSFMGLPTPNLFAGEHNFHSRIEWVSVQDMEKAVEVIVHLCRIWEERS